MFQILCICFLFIVAFNVCICFEEAWQAYHNSLRYANREELVITNVSTDENFKLDVNVKKWTTLSFGPFCYSVGLMNTGLAVLFANLDNDGNKLSIKSAITELNKTPIDVFLLQNRRELEAILIVAFQDDLKIAWYKILDTKLEPFCAWDLTVPVVHINAFSVHNKPVLLLASSSGQNSARVDLYQYELKNSSTHWFWQSIDVSNPVSSSAFNSFEFDSYISLPQKSLNQVNVFIYEDNRFVPYTTISSENVDNVVSFEIGFQSFLAIDGLQAGIYQFEKNGLARKDIINSNLDGIEFWLPVPVQTYKDEVVLFAQRKLDHASHNGYVIEIITYNGVKFEEHEDIQCTHFGENTQWLTCLAEHGGIIGSSYLVAEDKLGLIVPRLYNTSFLYMMHFEVKQIPNPLEIELKILLKEKENLQGMIDKQIREYKRLKNIHVTSNTFEIINGGSHQSLLRQSQRGDITFNDQLEAIAKEIENLEEKVDEIIERENKKEFDVITINGIVEVERESKFKDIEVENLGDEPATELLEDVVMKYSIGKITGDKIINNLKVQHITFDKVNGIEADDIVLNNGSIVKLEGNITIHDSAQTENINVITGLVNDVDLVNEIIDLNNGYEGLLNLEKIQVNNDFQVEVINDEVLESDLNNLSNINNILDVTPQLDSVTVQNLTVTNINGDDFDIFMRQLCFTNIKCYIPGDLKINGNITADKGSVSYLNDIKYPEGYVFKESDRVSTLFRGQKTFKNSLIAKDIRVRGKIDGVDPKKLITLSTNQEKIMGKITFKDVEVSQQLNVTGNILGEDIDKFLPNRSLNTVRNITSNVNFKNLEVDGNIIIDNYFNSQNFETTLKDLIYKDEEEAKIISQKEFSEGFTVKQNLEITSDSINNINIDLLVTKDTEQTLNITMLKGDVTINNIVVEGKFDGVNITQMDQDVVKLTGEQYISSTLTFTEDLDVEHFEVTETLNSVNIEDYLHTDDSEMDSDLRFEDIEVENLTVEGNFVGTIESFDIENFSKRYLSYSKDQLIEGHFDIMQSSIDYLKTERINGENYEDFFKLEKIAEKLKEMVTTNKVTIKDIYVHGLLQINSLNNKEEKEWLPTDEMKGLDGKYKKKLFIEGNIYFDILEINKISSIEWDWFNRQIVHKDELFTIMDAPFKNFLGGIKVAKLIETNKINGIPIEDILTKQGEQTFVGPIRIKGDVFFKNGVNIAKDMNTAAVGEILNNLAIENGTYHVKGDMLFERLPQILELDVMGYANNKNITEHLSHTVHLDEEPTLDGDFIFEKPVHIAGNFTVQQNINGKDITEMGSQIVLTTEDSKIARLVTFLQPVVVNEWMVVEGNLNTKTLYGIDLDEWKNIAVYLDEGMVEGVFGFDDIVIKDTLTIKYLNGFNMDSIIPLKSSDTIDYLQFGEITASKDLPVMGSVNGYSNISEEFDVTVMTNKDQKIHSNLVFNDLVLVRENIFTGFINDQDASKIVTTNTNQNLFSIFNFKAQCKVDADLRVHGFVNGINTTVWQRKNIKLYSAEIQNVYDDWNRLDDVTFSSNVEGDGFINDLNLTEVMEEVEDRKNYKYHMEHAIIEDYNNMCKDVSYLYESLKKQIYKFMYFEELQTIIFSNAVQHVYYFQFKDNHYVLVNENNCTSQLLIFNKRTFEHLSTVETGHISQVIKVRGDETMYLVTRDEAMDAKCEVVGTNVWHFDGNTIDLHYNIEQEDLLQESVVPNTFYGLNKQVLVEYKINFDTAWKYRKWEVPEENVAFVPRGLRTGLSLRTGHKILFLDRTDPLMDDFSLDSESTIPGNGSEILNHFMPGRRGGDLVVTKVGVKSARRNLLAVATHEETSVKGRLDFVKIYSDAINGEIFHKIPAYKPSSLLSVEFDQGETLLVFMENGKTLQVFEYKGIEGFKHRSSAKIEGSHLFLMTLPIEPYLNPRKTIGIVHKNKISIITAVMAGNKIRDDLKCGF